MPTREVYWILGSLLAAVSLASGIGQLLLRRHPRSEAIVNLNARIRSWWVLIAVGGGALWAGPIAILLMFAFISMVCLHEFLNGTLTAPGRMLCLFLAVPGQYLLIGLGRYDQFSSWIPVCWFLALATFVSLFSGVGGFPKRLAVTLCGLILCVFCLSHIPALAMVPISGFEGRAPLLMAFAVIVAQVSDVLQYVWGKLIGRHRLLPTLSPSKTVEGLVGGVLSVTAFGMLLSPLTPFTRWQAAGMAFLIAIFGFLGGVVTSAIKRDRGLKDWSQLIAGHGGMLDRVDSLCLSAPVFFYLTRHFFAC
jgi:phosphatidate cytidylyltransferase